MKTLLLIENDEINRQFLLEILQEDYVVLTAANGQQGLDILEKEAQNISAILLDIQMSVMNGFEFLKHVENNSDYNRIPILVTTVLEGEEDEKECLKLGVSDFIVKPYSPLLLKMRVENIIYMTESADMISELEMDALTGFKTRRAYYRDIEAMERDSTKEMQAAGLVFADINGLKRVNDRVGHEAGDELIASVAKQIAEVFPEADKYRIGGDEFVLVSFDDSEETFNTKLKRLKKNWKDDFSAAIGSVWVESTKELEKNISIADKMMYRDKSSYYENRMHERRRHGQAESVDALEQMELMAELLPGGFFVYHADGGEELITFNEELLKIFKCKNKEEFIELTGNSFKGMVHLDDLGNVEGDIIGQIKQEKDIDRVKYRIICKDGTAKTVLDYGRFVHTEMYGDVYYVFINDVTEDF